MKFIFDPNQQYQQDAVKSVVDIFKGQPKADIYSYLNDIQSQLNGFDIGAQTKLVDYNIIANAEVNLSDSLLANNVFEIQANNNLAKSAHVTINLPTDNTAEVLFSEKLNINNDFTVEMETGTGKTYVYLRTIFELNAKYGWTKFIIVVPRIAIKEGVIKSYSQMKDHFAEIYNSPKVNFRQWNSKKRGIGKQFAYSPNIEILLLNIDAFARTRAIFNSDSDNGKPLDYIAQTKPIIILDEPQNMESPKRRDAINSLNPLFSLRYSATHKEIKNLVYSLNPVQAYNMGLVKQIEVDSVLLNSGDNKRLLAISHSSKNKPIAKLELDISDKAGLQKRAFSLMAGDELSDYAKREVYKGWIIDNIDTENSFIQFTNGEVLKLGVASDQERHAIIQTQIDQTVRNHFEKQKQLKNADIKVLSLFFIDKVANYVNDGFISQYFEQAFSKYANWPQFKDVIPYSAKQVHDGYFSTDSKGNAKDLKDSAEGATANDKDTISAYDRILKRKEQLISFNEPLCFLFSHTALREGWDNPNVFQICTINESVSTMRKRQEIGRGLRLAVNEHGQRVFDNKINVLTVIANESYDEFASKLQTEIEQDTGIKFDKRNIKPKTTDPIKIKLNKDITNNPDFKELWQKINQKTTYSLSFDEDALIYLASQKFANEHIAMPMAEIIKTKITDINATGIQNMVVNETMGNKYTPNYNFDLLKFVQKQTHLKRKTIKQIIDGANNFNIFIKSPQNYADTLVNVIELAKQDLLVDGIKYKKLDDIWAISLFNNDEVEKYFNDVYEPADLTKTTHNYVRVDSIIEYDYAYQLDNNSQIKFYFKLPKGFSIATPLGQYRPDWAVVFEADARIYFVSETKGVNNINDQNLKPAEKLKILYGQQHFKTIGQGVEFIAPTNAFIDTLSKLQL